MEMGADLAVWGRAYGSVERIIGTVAGVALILGGITLIVLGAAKVVDFTLEFYLGLGLALIALGGFSIWFARWLYRTSRKSPEGAEFVGALGVFDIARRLA